MKKMKRFTMAVMTVLLVCMAFVFTSSCSVLESLGLGAKIEGTYKFDSLSYQQDGVTVEIKAGEKFLGLYIIEEDFAVITLNEDGTATMNISTEATVEQGTWEKGDNNTVYITDSLGDREECFCNGRTLEFFMIEDGIVMQMVLKK